MTSAAETATTEPTPLDNPSSDTTPERQDFRTARAAIQILCLHEAHSNANETQLLLKPLDERLYAHHGIEFVYINAPLVVVNKDEEGEHRKRIWWENHSEEQPYAGLDASLMHLQQIWQSNPFSGILALGQGASIAALLPMLEPSLEFGMFVHNAKTTKAMLEEEEALMANWNCLHIIREEDTQNADTQRLVKQFPGQIHVRTTDTCTTSTVAGLSKADFNSMGKFLVQQKKNMRTNGSGEALVVQTQLQRVEHQASRLIAEHIAADPPKALMAVITPQGDVSGWQGSRRRAFGAEGGGAPCPSEFLLNRQERDGTNDESSHNGGPSRQHPASANEQDEGGQHSIG